jgi:hypothetical protein
MREATHQAYARFAGLMYLLVDLFDIGGVVILGTVTGTGGFLAVSHNISSSETLYRVGICCGLLGILLTVLLAAGLYVTVKPVDPNLAMTALLFRLVESAIAGVAIVLAFATLQIYLDASLPSAFDLNQLATLADVSSRLSVTPTGVATIISVIFFSVGSAIFFYLFLRSAYIPRILAAGGLFASLFCLITFGAGLVFAQSAQLLFGIGGLPIGIAEVITGLWLLIRGITTQSVKSHGLTKIAAPQAE